VLAKADRPMGADAVAERVAAMIGVPPVVPNAYSPFASRAAFNALTRLPSLACRDSAIAFS